jgi:methionyl-tRNA formyltransferase
VIRTLAGLAQNTIVPQPQEKFLKPGEVLKPAPKIYPENCIIDWNNDPCAIHNLIRGLAPYPGARSEFRKNKETLSFKIFESQPESTDHKFKPGYIISDGKHFLRIACNKGFINVENIQLEGKNRMNTVEFLRGFNIPDYTIPAKLQA